MHGKFELLSLGKVSSHRTALPSLFVFSCVQCFRASVIHQTLTWATGSLTCVHGHSYACIYTQGLGTLTSQHNILTRKLSQIFLCSGRGLNLWSLDLKSMLYQLSHPVYTCTCMCTSRCNILKCDINI